jgi:hypothetical protein
VLNMKNTAANGLENHDIIDVKQELNVDGLDANDQEDIIIDIKQRQDDIDKNDNDINVGQKTDNRDAGNNTVSLQETTKCGHCDYSACSKFALSQHTQSVHGLKCDYCDFYSFKKADLKKHVNRAHGEEFKCSICDFEAQGEAALKFHLSRGHSLSCELCPSMRFNITTLIAHKKVVHSEGPLYTCQTCRFITLDQNGLHRHYSKSTKCSSGELKVRNRQNLYSRPTVGCLPCLQCNYVGSSIGQLTRHNKYAHKDVSIFKCYRCQFTSKLKEELVAHANVEHDSAPDKPKPDEEKHKCKHCSFKTRFITGLNCHMKIKHKSIINEQQTISKCCEQLFSDQNALDMHNKEFHKNGFQCDMCSYMAPGTIELKHHLQSGHDYKCECCPEFTFSPFSLQAHKRNEHKLKCDVCPHCGMVCLTGKNLRRHIQLKHRYLANLKFTLPKLTRFKCCEETFSDQSALDMHNKTFHNDGFQCDMCSHKAPTVPQLNKHRKSGHNYKCGRCPGLKFSLFSLRAHTRSKHAKLKTHIKTKSEEEELLDHQSMAPREISCNRCEFKACAKRDLSLHYLRAHHSVAVPLAEWALQNDASLEAGHRLNDYSAATTSYLMDRTKTLATNSLGEGEEVFHPDQESLVVSLAEYDGGENPNLVQEEIGIKNEVECDEPECILPD